MQLRRLAVAGSLAALLAGCVGQRVEYGFTERPMAVPENAISCGEGMWERTVTVQPAYPRALFILDRLSPDGHHGRSRSFDIRYDITPDGKIANMRHEGPEWQLRHEAMQQTIDLTTDAVERWEFEWRGDGPARHARDCLAQFNFTQQSWSG